MPPHAETTQPDPPPLAVSAGEGPEAGSEGTAGGSPEDAPPPLPGEAPTQLPPPPPWLVEAANRWRAAQRPPLPGLVAADLLLAILSDAAAALSDAGLGGTPRALELPALLPPLPPEAAGSVADLLAAPPSPGPSPADQEQQPPPHSSPAAEPEEAPDPAPALAGMPAAALEWPPSPDGPPAQAPGTPSPVAETAVASAPGAALPDDDPAPPAEERRSAAEPPAAAAAAARRLQTVRARLKVAGGLGLAAGVPANSGAQRPVPSSAAAAAFDDSDSEGSGGGSDAQPAAAPRAAPAAHPAPPAQAPAAGDAAAAAAKSVIRANPQLAVRPIGPHRPRAPTPAERAEAEFAAEIEATADGERPAKRRRTPQSASPAAEGAEDVGAGAPPALEQAPTPEQPAPFAEGAATSVAEREAAERKARRLK